MANPHVGDVGVVITVTVKDQDNTAVDISTASAKSFTVKKPSGATTTWTATFVTDGTDGKVKYTTVANDLDQTGVWLLQVNLTLSSWSAKSDPASFQVEPNL